MKIRKLSLVLFLLLCVNLGYAKLEIIVKPSPDWGPIPTVDVQRLCDNIVEHFEIHLRPENEINDKVNVSRTFRGFNFATLDSDPDVKYQIGIQLLKDMEIRVDDFYYFIMPFAHEICHIIHRFDVISVGNPNLWFHEGISTMGGVWALRRMAKTWEDESPFGVSVAQDGGIAFFSKNFNHYANAYLEVFPKFQYDGTGKEWLDEFELLAREDSYHGSTKFNTIPAQLAFKFLPIFEENPEAWNAVRKMPATKGKMSEYIQDWYDAVDAQDRDFVEAIATEMGITVTSVVPIIGDLTMNAQNNVPKNADFVNLTFTHNSNTSLTPVNNPNDWDGWVAGIWEKTPDGIIGKKSNHYWNFAEMDTWSHWIYSSAPASIEYDISSGTHTKFSSYFGVPHQGPDYACIGGPSVQLVAYADNREIYRSDVLYRDDHGVYIEFDVPSETKTLTLEIGDVENQHCDNYIFGEPKLYIAPSADLEEDNINADVNNDGYIDLYDVMIVRSGMQNSVSYDTDVNNDGITDEVDLLIVKAKAVEAIVAAAPRKRKIKLTTWGSVKMR